MVEGDLRLVWDNKPGLVGQNYDFEQVPYILLLISSFRDCLALTWLVCISFYTLRSNNIQYIVYCMPTLGLRKKTAYVYNGMSL